MTNYLNLAWYYRGKLEQQWGSSKWESSPSASEQLLYITLVGFACLGAWTLLRFVGSYFRLLLSLFVLPGQNLRSFGPPSKSWAIVTGASEGIGKEFALQLARTGYSVILISRTESKLDAVAKEIKAKFNTATKVVPIDFGAVDISAALDRLTDEVGKLDIAILINNVGRSHSIPVSFVETPVEEMEQIILINNLNTLRLTRAVVPRMLTRRSSSSQQKPRSLILTVGSFAGSLPTPLLATYSGSKAFLQQWSSALAYELAPHGITVQLAQSYLVTTAMSKIRRASWLIPTPRAWVRSALGRIGRTGGAQGFAQGSSTPYWSHALLQWAMANLLPGGLQGSVLLRLNGDMHEGIRKRALKKAQKSK